MSSSKSLASPNEFEMPLVLELMIRDLPEQPRAHPGLVPVPERAAEVVPARVMSRAQRDHRRVVRLLTDAAAASVIGLNATAAAAELASGARLSSRPLHPLEVARPSPVAVRLAPSSKPRLATERHKPPERRVLRQHHRVAPISSSSANSSSVALTCVPEP